MSTISLPLPWPGAQPMVSPTLARTLLLALLLHVWLVLMLGSAPGGTARPGQGVWGALNVTLRGPASLGTAETAAPPPVPAGPVGPAVQPRWGGAVREAAPVAPQTPGAVRLGEWAAAPQPAQPALEPAPVPMAAPAPLPVAVPVPAMPTVPETLGRLVAPEAPSPAVPALPDGRAMVPAVAVDLPATPALAQLPAAPAPAPAPVPVPVPVPVPEAPLPRLTRAVPAAVAAVAPLASPDRQPVDLAAPVALPQALPALAPAPSMPGATGTAAATGGLPDAGSQVGHDVATPPAAAASVPPRLNLQLARPRGGELSRFSAPGVLSVLPRPPELPDKLAKDIAKSAKGDCRTAYQGAGLLAVVPLAVEALRKDSGCKW